MLNLIPGIDFILTRVDNIKIYEFFILVKGKKYTHEDFKREYYSVYKMILIYFAIIWNNIHFEYSKNWTNSELNYSNGVAKYSGKVTIKNCSSIPLYFRDKMVEVFSGIEFTFEESDFNKLLN